MLKRKILTWSLDQQTMKHQYVQMASKSYMIRTDTSIHSDKLLIRIEGVS